MSADRSGETLAKRGAGISAHVIYICRSFGSLKMATTTCQKPNSRTVVHFCNAAKQEICVAANLCHERNQWREIVLPKDCDSLLFLGAAHAGQIKDAGQERACDNLRTKLAAPCVSLATNFTLQALPRVFRSVAHLTLKGQQPPILQPDGKIALCPRYLPLSREGEPSQLVQTRNRRPGRIKYHTGRLKCI